MGSGRDRRVPPLLSNSARESCVLRGGAQHLPRGALRARRLLDAAALARTPQPVRLGQAGPGRAAALRTPRAPGAPPSRARRAPVRSRPPARGAQADPRSCHQVPWRGANDGGLQLMSATKERGNGRVAAPDLAESVSGLLTNAVNELAKRTVSRVPRADLDNRDTDYIRETLPGLWMLASLYFRADVRGLHHIQREGPVLLVGNHSGGMMAPDLFVFVLAFSTYFGVERRFFQLAHNGVVAGPTGRLVRPFGTVAADPRNAGLALESDAAVLV